jgi:hypothetical protein
MVSAESSPRFPINSAYPNSSAPLLQLFPLHSVIEYDRIFFFVSRFEITISARLEKP